MDRSLGGLQSHSVCFWRKRNVLLLPGVELRCKRAPARSLVTTPTTPWRFLRPVTSFRTWNALHIFLHCFTLNVQQTTIFRNVGNYSPNKIVFKSYKSWILPSICFIFVNSYATCNQRLWLDVEYEGVKNRWQICRRAIKCQLFITACGQIRKHRVAVPLLCVLVFNDVSCDGIFCLPPNGNRVPRSSASSMPFALNPHVWFARFLPCLGVT